MTLGRRAGVAMLVAGWMAVAPVSAEQAPPAPPAVPPGVETGAPPDDIQYFEPEREWTFDWGTDTTFTLSNRESGSTNETNDRTTPFDGLWMRLYGRLSYGERAELVVDLFATEAHSPSLFGLYGKLEFHRLLGLRVGLLPLVFGAWQDRAYPSRQPLIGAPLHSQYLLGVQSGHLPKDLAYLRLWREPGYLAEYGGGSGSGSWASLAYEHCWDTGVEVFGDAGKLHYRLAVMEGTPGLMGVKSRLNKDGGSLEARVTYKVSDALRLGTSLSAGSYLQNSVRDSLPAGTSVTDFRQDLLGGDVKLVRGPVEINADYVFSRFDSPFTDPGSGPRRANLDVHGYSGEVAVELAPGFTVAGRVSGLLFGKVASAGATDPYGYGPAATVADGRWDDRVFRFEAGARYRFWENVDVKAVYQRTTVDSTPRRVEDIGALQLVFAH